MLRRRAYHSVIRQSLHYLARPHSGIPRQPIGGPAAWRGDELAARDDWQITLDAAAIAELERALAFARRTGRPLGRLRAEDFPLPRLHPRIRAWARELTHGRGVVLLRGLPVERWTVDDASIVFWGLGQHLGRPGAQNGRGDLLGRVRDQGLSYTDPAVRGYQTAAGLAFHTDFADVVGLLCLRAAASGGRSRFVSSVRVYDELLARHPELIERLFAPTLFDTRGDAGIDYVTVIPCRYDRVGDRRALRTLWHGDYLRSAAGKPGAPAIPPETQRLLDTYDDLANEPGMAIELEFRPGDVQLLSNHTVLHGRTPYVDGDDPEQRRDLLRLWLSVELDASLRGQISRAQELGRLALAIGRAQVRNQVRNQVRRHQA